MVTFHEAKVKISRILTLPGLPIVVFCANCIHWPSTPEYAKLFTACCLGVWAAGASIFYYVLWHASWSLVVKGGIWFMYLLSWDAPLLATPAASWTVYRCLTRTDCDNRLFNRKAGEKLGFKGPRICVLGNGPSLATGKPCGDMIDSMDEVVRFNNFQTKSSGMEKWSGTKTTVHFSDSMLFPSYPEYKVPGACTVLSLFMDRLVVSGSYFAMRGYVDGCPMLALEMLFDKSLGWVSHEDIANLSRVLGLPKNKHPTSGCLAIDWFVRNRPDPSVPVHIHGFDFFQGPTIHYYNKTEPLYERINDHLGVNMMHAPHLEKVYVERLVEEGKVKWLVPKDEASDSSK